MDDTQRRRIGLAIPLVLIPSMVGVFRGLTALLGRRWGRIASFLVYWVGWCGAVPLALLGPHRVRAMFRRSRPMAAPERAVAIATLAFPPIGGVITQALPRRREADATLVTTALALAAVNATAEEVLWRGVFVELFPERWALAVLYPAVGFTLWHIAPVMGQPDKRRLALFFFGATWIGLATGSVAYRTRSLCLTTLAHILSDAPGLTSAALWLGRATSSAREHKSSH
jgi:membrane protease YdiL (CAAX protease family)